MSRLDKAALLQTIEERQRAVGQDMAIAGDAEDLMNLAAWQAFEVNGPALGKGMQHTLLVF